MFLRLTITPDGRLLVVTPYSTHVMVHCQAKSRPVTTYKLISSGNKSHQCLSDLSRLICLHQVVSSVRFVTKSVSLPPLSCQEKKARQSQNQESCRRSFKTFQHPQPVRLTLDCKLRHPSPPYTKSYSSDKDLLKKLNIPASLNSAVSGL